MKYDAITNPIMNPHVDPKNISSPPVIPPNHGINAIPKTMYMIWLKHPYFYQAIILNLTLQKSEQLQGQESMEEE